MTRLAIALPFLLLGTATVLADDRKPEPQAPPLPGVEGDYSIVRPAPEPLEADGTEPGTIRAGNWELTVSGYMWVQVGGNTSVGR